MPVIVPAAIRSSVCVTDIAVLTVRQGRTSCSQRVEMRQDGSPVFMGSVWSVAPNDGLEHHAAVAPSVLEPDQLSTFDRVAAGVRDFRFWDNVESRRPEAETPSALPSGMIQSGEAGFVYDLRQPLTIPGSTQLDRSSFSTSRAGPPRLASMSTRSLSSSHQASISMSPSTSPLPQIRGCWPTGTAPSVSMDCLDGPVASGRRKVAW